MKTYKETFKNLKIKNQGALIPFTVIGYPDYQTSLDITKGMADSGADMLELGIPFSDPIADGPSIQAADMQALDNGMNTDRVFQFIMELRKHTKIPIGILSYYNLVYQRGIKKFFRQSAEAGINSVLIPDMPIEESDCAVKESKNNNMDTVFMISPLTENHRIQKIAGHSTGFVYAVARLGVTGATSNLNSNTLNFIERAKKFSSAPLCAGFGISSTMQVRSLMRAGADGAIVGSAVIDLIAKNINNRALMLNELREYIKSLKEATIFRKK